MGASAGKGIKQWGSMSVFFITAPEYCCTENEPPGTGDSIIRQMIYADWQRAFDLTYFSTYNYEPKRYSVEQETCISLYVYLAT